MKAERIELSEDDYEEMLTDVYGTVTFGCLIFDAGRIIRELDETSFRCGMADEPEKWVCRECNSEFDNEEEANECCKED